MKPFLYKFFHRSTKDKSEGGLVSVPSDVSKWPESWKTTEYKKIPFFNPIPLVGAENTKLFDLLSRRSSDRKLLHENAITIEKISNLFKCAYGEIKRRNGSIHRTVPSGGARYSIELYLVLFKNIEGLESGVYHYGTKDHCLELIKQRSFSSEDILFYQNDTWATSGGGMICMSSIFDRTTRKYGSRGYRYIMLEAGHIGQNILLSGVENNLTFVPNGSTYDTRVEDLLKLDGEEESLIYTISF